MSSLERLREVRPEMYNYFSNLTRFDPITGALNPEYDAMIQSLTAPQVAASSGSGGGGDDGPVFADEIHAANTAFAGGNQGSGGSSGYNVTTSFGSGSTPAPVLPGQSTGSIGGLLSGISDAKKELKNTVLDALGVV